MARPKGYLSKTIPFLRKERKGGPERRTDFLKQMRAAQKRDFRTVAF